MRVVITGAAGFIGADLIHGLNRLGITDIVAVDDLTNGPKLRISSQPSCQGYFTLEEFYNRCALGELGHFDVTFHQGACSHTMDHATGAS